MKNSTFLAIGMLMMLSSNLISQYNIINHCLGDGSYCYPNSIITSAYFLRMGPDAKSQSLGHNGLTTSNAASSMHFNSSTLAFAEGNAGVSLSNSIMQSNFSIGSEKMPYLAGYYKLDSLKAIGASLRYYDFDSFFPFTDLEAALSYNFTKNKKLAFGITIKYINSKTTFNGFPPGPNIEDLSTNAFAFDFSLSNRKSVKMFGRDGEWKFGFALTNIGGKLDYLDDPISPHGDYIPANLGIGNALVFNVSEKSQFTFSIDLNKYLLPSTQSFTILDDDLNEIG